MDFYKIQSKIGNNKKITIYPSFIVGQNRDLMVQGKSFYAIWNEDTGLWSKNEFDVARIVDRDINKYIDEHTFGDGASINVSYLSDFSSSTWNQYKKYISLMPNNYKQLDTKITFSNTEVKKTDYISRRLPYAMEEGDISAYEEIMSTLYDPEQREKIEWAIGAIISGDSKRIQKFIGLYGGPGTGKSTVLNIIEALFEGYCVTFDAKELVSGTNAFAGDAFATNPLVGIQHDGDLSKINDNSLLNTIVSHEKMIINEKFKSKYEIKLNTFLFIATNEPFKITNINSGLSRRLIDVHPSGRLIDTDRYYILMEKVMNEELGHIANHCLSVYEEHGKNRYSYYKPVDMMYRTDPFFNFVQDHIMLYPTVVADNCITLGAAYEEYKRYRVDEEISYSIPKYKFRDNLKDYFEQYIEGQHRSEKGEKLYNVFYGLKKELFEIARDPEKSKVVAVQNKDTWLDLKEQHSNLDDLMADFPAQYTRIDNKNRTNSKIVRDSIRFDN